MKTFYTLFLVAIIVGGLILSINIHFSVAQAGTRVSGIISQNTTWTKTSSPYSLTGIMAVKSGVTLTIEAGVTINLNSYFIEVNGTLNAIGTISDLINLKGGSSAGDLDNPFVPLQPSAITFYGSGTVRYANVRSQISIYTSPTITNTYGANILILNGSPLILYNSNVAITEINGSPTISGNTNTSIYIEYGSPVITNNTIKAGIQINGGNALIRNNAISGPSSQGSISIDAGNPTIENNLITDSSGKAAIEFGAYAFPTIQNNTFSNTGGISTGSGNAQMNLLYNNFKDISGHSIYWGSSSNLSAIYNYWGTTDAQAINQSIYDFKNDFRLGTVTFFPFLIAPNLEAPAIPMSTPSLTVSPTATSAVSPSPSIPELPAQVLVPLAAIIVLTALVIIKRKKLE